MNEKKSRIEYVDLMKGICISLVVIVHCDVSFPVQIANDMLQNLRMPLYFFLTGLFFKPYNSFLEFVIRKTNKLIIPYIFFAFIPYLFFDLFFSSGVNRSLFYYCFMLIEPYNYPLWFLRSLFVSYLFFYLIYELIIRFSPWIGMAVVLLLSYVSWWFSFRLPAGNYSYLLQNLITSIFALPFIYVATYARKAGVLTKAFACNNLVIVFIIGFLVWAVCAQNNVVFIKAHFGNNYPLLYFSALGGISCLWVICYRLKKLFYFSYVGRYSIVVLGTFAPVSRYLSSQFGLTGSIQAIITLAVMPLFIWISVRCFPYLTAQKNLIRV